MEINDISGLSSWGTLQNGWDNDDKQWMSVPQLANPQSGSLRHAFQYKCITVHHLGMTIERFPKKIKALLRALPSGNLTQLNGLPSVDPLCKHCGFPQQRTLVITRGYLLVARAHSHENTVSIWTLWTQINIVHGHHIISYHIISYHIVSCYIIWMGYFKL